MSCKKFDFNHKDIYLLLGPQEVGKTCFLGGLYYAFRSALNGFSLSCVNDEQRVELDDMCKNLEEGIFPFGTSGSTDYQFVLRYAHQERFSFEWFDYRGGMLAEYGTKNHIEYQELTDIVKNSTCILICVDGTWLSSDKDKCVKNIQDKGYAVNEFLDKYRDSNGILPPICIVITKYDKCDSRYETEYFEAIKESFAFFEDSNAPIFICPISIGREKNEKFIFDPTDTDVYRPLFFALWCGYNYRVAGLKQNLKNKKKIFTPLLNELNDEIKKLENATLVINKQKKIEEKKQDISKCNNLLKKEEERIDTLECEQKKLLETICASEDIYWGTERTTWEEVEDKWKFFH